MNAERKQRVARTVAIQRTGILGLLQLAQDQSQVRIEFAIVDYRYLPLQLV